MTTNSVDTIQIQLSKQSYLNQSNDNLILDTQNEQYEALKCS